MVYVELYCLVLFPPLTVHQFVDPKVLDLNHILVKPYKKQCYPSQLIYVWQPFTWKEWHSTGFVFQELL